MHALSRGFFLLFDPDGIPRHLSGLRRQQDDLQRGLGNRSEARLLAQKREHFQHHRVFLLASLSRHDRTRFQPIGCLCPRLLRHLMRRLSDLVLENFGLQMLPLSGAVLEHSANILHRVGGGSRVLGQKHPARRPAETELHKHILEDPHEPSATDIPDDFVQFQLAGSSHQLRQHCQVCSHRV